MADKKKTSELTTNSSPSTSATLVGVEEREVEGETIKETVQIPITEFVTKDENGGVFIRTKQGKNIIEVCETEDESFTAIQSNALQLHGVSSLRTYDDKEGNDGQVLTKKDGRVTWGDIPDVESIQEAVDDHETRLTELEENGSSEGLTYTLSEDGTSYIVSGIGTCTDTDIIIPSTYNEKPVTSIGNEAFARHSNLITVEIPNSVTSIGDYAFYSCSRLTTMVIPDSVISMGHTVFYTDTLLTIYCEATSQPSGWDTLWNRDNRPVVWNITTDILGLNAKFADHETRLTELEENGSSGGSSSPMTDITYAELKALRDGGNLIPGMFYRITDYVCTTAQADTRATDHRFDIIVQALSNNKLSETAKADYNSDDSYFADNNANLSAWEIKYCLDNDTTRFAWALDGQAITNLESMYSGDTPLVRQASSDGRLEGAIGEPTEYYYAWGTQSDVDDGDPADFIYSKNETITNGEIVYSACDGELKTAEVIEGKGVIYYMKDEHGNECPYDFKNIQFKRHILLENGYPELDMQSIEEGGDHNLTWVYTFCGNSYHIDNDEWSELKDGSLESPYQHESDENTYTFCNNTMKPYYMIIDFENEDHTKCGKQYLNNNVFFGWWEVIDSTSPDNYPYYYACCCAFIELGYNCQNNTFGRGCRHITVSNECNDNIFMEYCVSIKLGYQCNSNIAYLGSATLGDHCSSNVLRGNNLILLNEVCCIDTSSEYPDNKIYKGNFEIV
jgi:inorganic pyrophosphatase